MKSCAHTLVGILVITGSVLAQPPNTTSCNSYFGWEPNNQILLFAPGIAVNFYGKAEGDISSWFWDFGDGFYSSEQNPMHIFNFKYGVDGTLERDLLFPKVCLTIKTSGGCSSVYCETLNLGPDTIIPEDTLPACSLYFYPYPYFSDTFVTIPELIPYGFKTVVPENTVEWYWEFGDGSTSQEMNPVHLYDFSGEKYEACLTIKTSDGCNVSYCAPVYLVPQDTFIEPGCEAKFMYNILESYPEQYAFQDLSTGNPVQWFWDFGDGTFSEEKNPVHIFDKKDTTGYRFIMPPGKSFYKVCLTVLNADQCKSMYCDYVYPGIVVIDTVYPEPCPFYISITTSGILGGNICSGSASASLVDVNGNPVQSSDFYWSTGQNGNTINGLCANVPYWVSVKSIDGCEVMGSFAFTDYTKPVDPFGYWQINGYESGYNFYYNLPDSDYVCEWIFSDGTIKEGEEVNYSFMEGMQKSVTVNVYDENGKIVFTNEISLGNSTTDIRESNDSGVLLFPNPVRDHFNVTFNSAFPEVRLMIYNTLGQLKKDMVVRDVLMGNPVRMDVSSLPKGSYYLKVVTQNDGNFMIPFIK